MNTMTPTLDLDITEAERVVFIDALSDALTVARAAQAPVTMPLMMLRVSVMFAFDAAERSATPLVWFAMDSTERDHACSTLNDAAELTAPTLPGVSARLVALSERFRDARPGYTVSRCF